MNHIIYRLVLTALLTVCSTKAYAAPLPVCTDSIPPNPALPAPGVPNIATINKGTARYTVDDFGGSIFWSPSPSSDPFGKAHDVLSGDDAVHLRYQIGGQTVSEWLPTFLAGNCFAGYGYQTNSPFGNNNNIISPVQTLGLGNISRSEIKDTNVHITITTTIDAGGNVHQGYDILNVSGDIISGIQFTDFLTFHPNGSTVDPITGVLGTTSFVNRDGVFGLLVTGDRSQSNFVADVFLFGGNRVGTIPFVPSRPTDHDIGKPSTGVIGRVENEQYNHFDGPCVNDPTVPITDFVVDMCSGALMWELVDVGSGEVRSFEIQKNLFIPEPGSAWLLLSGFGTLFLRRLRLRKK